MKASSESFTSSRTETTKNFQLNVESTTTTQFPAHGGSSFTFGGFGRNDPKNKKLPTAGSYSKSRTMGYLGYETYQSYSGNGTLIYQTISSGARSEARLGEMAALETSDASSVYNKALSKFNDMVKNSDLNIAVTLAESGQTLRMMKALSEVVTLARDARKFVKTGKASKRLKELVHRPSMVMSKLWLQMKYGWMPLYSDIYGLLEFSSRTFKEMDYKARSKQKYPPPPPSSNPAFGLYSTIEGKRFYSVEIGATLSVADQTAFDVSRITSLNPVTIAWELVPFSFVVDWFVDIGGYLENMELALSNNLVWKHGYRTDLAFSECRETLRVNHVTSTTRRWGTYYANVRSVSKNRILLGSYPRPVFPNAKAKLGAQRVMSAAALLRTILLKGH